MATLAQIKNWFKTGLKPTQLQFSDTWDSFWHKSQIIPAANIENLDARFDEKADNDAFLTHVDDLTAHGIGAMLTNLKTQIEVIANGSLILNWKVDVVPEGGRTYAQKHGDKVPVFIGFTVTEEVDDEQTEQSYMPNLYVTRSTIDGTISTVRIEEIFIGKLIII